jgi:hypothetical protein
MGMKTGVRRGNYDGAGPGVKEVAVTLPASISDEVRLNGDREPVIVVSADCDTTHAR